MMLSLSALMGQTLAPRGRAGKHRSKPPRAGQWLKLVRELDRRARQLALEKYPRDEFNRRWQSVLLFVAFRSINFEKTIDYARPTSSSLRNFSRTISC